MWSTPESKFPPPATLSAVEVHDALLTSFDRGPLRTETGPTRWVRGAVHTAAGTLVTESQRRWHGTQLEPVAADPVQVDVPASARELEGSWLYVGHWSGHFGHFLLETLPALWPDPVGHDLRGLVAHRPVRGRLSETGDAPDPAPWQRRLVELAGYGGLQHEVVDRDPVRVPHLLVPERPTLLKRWVHQRALDTWQRVSEAVGGGEPGGRVYLSRTRFHEAAGNRARTDHEWDTILDRAFADAGFDVVHPETLPLDEQIRAVRRADVIAGPAGSALHLSVFAPAGTRVLSVGDRRTPSHPGPTQAVLDAAIGRRTRHVDYGDHAALEAILDVAGPTRYRGG